MRAAACIALLFLISAYAHSQTFDTRDQNPLLAGFGLAQPVAARIASDNQHSMQLNWGNTALIQKSNDEMLLADAESREWRLSYEHALNNDFAVRVQLPYHTTDGGVLDGFITHWHSWFGLPNGGRNRLPRNNFAIDYQRGGVQELHFDTHALSGIGDLSLAAGYQLHSSERSATALWWTLKLPTGNSSQLTGSDAIDSTLTLAHEYRLSSRWLANAQASASYLGSGKILADQQKHLVWQGLLGIDYRYSNALTLSLQLDAHTAVFNDTALNMLGNAWILTMGGDYVFASKWRVQLGVSEDVKVDASPDVNFVVSISRDIF